MTLTVWQAISHRHTDLLKVWDSGRVTEIELKKLAVMIWSNLNDMLTPGASLSPGGGLALSLPEACRMLEALISQLSSRFQLAPVPTQASARIAALRAQLERIREQGALDPPEVREVTGPQIQGLASDIAAIISKADRGGDIGGILGPAEVKAARLERDLIVGHSERIKLIDQVRGANTRRAALLQRETAVADLVKKTQASVDPAPKYAVPRVAALGEVPSTEPALSAYLARLDQVSAALDHVLRANLAAGEKLGSLQERMSRAFGDSTTLDPIRENLATQIHQLLNAQPAPIDVIEPLIAAFEASRRQS
jgi:hypothetical protein